MRTLIVLAALALPAVAAAQASAAGPGSKLVFEIDPGRMVSGTGTVPRPEANLAFDLRIDGSATLVAGVKSAPCVVQTAPVLTCSLTLPTLTEGTHVVEVRGKPSPAETGVTPGGFSAPFSFTIVVVTAPGIPVGTRLVP